MAPVTLSIKGRALRLLSQREHSRQELERKLAVHATSSEELTQALDELQAKGWISEARVAESVVHRRADKLGLGRIRQELQAKGLAPELVHQTVAALKDSEFARARQVWQKKFPDADTDRLAQARQARFLLSRGFSSELVRRVLATAGREPELGSDEASED